MNLADAVELILDKRMSRVIVRPGNGLTRSMNLTLRSYSEVPQIIRRTVACMADLEQAFGLNGTVRLQPKELYRLLSKLHADWTLDVPELLPLKPTGARPVAFVTKPRLPLHQFTAAWTIARRIKLISGHGVIGLHQDVLTELRRLTSAPTQEGSRDPPKGMTRYDHV
ncbi:MAG: hypothetical protein ACM3VW_07635 [Bacteroidota bacterium]